MILWKNKKITSFRDDYNFLSNFYFAKITWEGVDFPSVEHAYQASKTKNIRVRKIMAKMSAADTKTLGRALTLWDGWTENKLGIMEELVWLKFSTNEILKERLLATGDLEIEEGNWWHDGFWGVDLHKGSGENYLGKILMYVREGLREDAE